MKHSRKVGNLLAELAERGVADDLVRATLARAEEHGLITGRPRGRHKKLNPLHLDVVTAVDHLRGEHLSIRDAARVLAIGGALPGVSVDELTALYGTGRRRPLVAETIAATTEAGSPRLRVDVAKAEALGGELETLAERWPAFAQHLRITDEVIDHLHRDEVIDSYAGMGDGPFGRPSVVIWHRPDYVGPRYVPLAIRAVERLPVLRGLSERGGRGMTLIFAMRNPAWEVTEAPLGREARTKTGT